MRSVFSRSTHVSRHRGGDDEESSYTSTHAYHPVLGMPLQCLCTGQAGGPVEGQGVEAAGVWTQAGRPAQGATKTIDRIAHCAMSTNLLRLSRAWLVGSGLCTLVLGMPLQCVGSVLAHTLPSRLSPQSRVGVWKLLELVINRTAIYSRGFTSEGSGWLAVEYVLSWQAL
jgi:hypothetical protein